MDGFLMRIGTSADIGDLLLKEKILRLQVQRMYGTSFILLIAQDIHPGRVKTGDSSRDYI